MAHEASTIDPLVAVFHFDQGILSRPEVARLTAWAKAEYGEDTSPVFLSTPQPLGGPFEHLFLMCRMLPWDGRMVIILDCSPEYFPEMRRGLEERQLLPPPYGELRERGDLTILYWRDRQEFCPV